MYTWLQRLLDLLFVILYPFSMEAFAIYRRYDVEYGIDGPIATTRKILSI